ncbi:hypothetical protein CAPTEDRAFT_213274 [Capitella teleta]|uniref:PH domain-containing protein n=1 Tax=Capitella teleta TaxID=283909 RepID=R7UQI2_CAPTE|nr:hypothetical protein CAPTEDRAFT_213274 [Capitella teleta]|eukprot:ELU08368.1 hypothetical protein CAPTEDRAFT_213274 [Capitella teleta]
MSSNKSNSEKMKFVLMTSSAVAKQQNMDKQRLHSVTMATRLGALHGSDIVKTGYLHIKRPPSKQPVKLRIKTWQKRFLVLRDESFQDGTTMLEIFNSQQDWLHDPFNAKVYTVDLQNVSHVEEYRDSKSHPCAFVVTRRGRSPLVIGAENELEMNQWLVAIKFLADKLKSIESKDRRPSCPSFLRLTTRTPQGPRKGNTYSPPPSTEPFNLTPRKGSDSSKLSTSPPTAVRNGKSVQDTFPVTIQPTESSEKRRIATNCLLTIRDNDILLADAETHQELLKWSVIHIRKFKSDTVGTGLDQITLEASQQAGSASGVFSFTTYCGPEIIDRVRQAKRRQSSDRVCRNLEQQMERLKNSLALPPLTPIERAPSAPCLFESPRAALPLPPVPPRDDVVRRKQSTTSSSSGSSASSTRDFLDQPVNLLPGKQIMLGSGYLDLLDVESSEKAEEKIVLKREFSLDDLVATLSDDESVVDNDQQGSIRQDSGFIDTFDALRVTTALHRHDNEDDATPPPLPPRDRSGSKVTPTRSRSPTEEPENIMTHL